MAKFALHSLLVLFLTLLTQIGGIAWLAALKFRPRFLSFAVIYAILCAATLLIAPQFGREPLPCTSDGPLRMQSKLYCVLNRQYVTPELRSVLRDHARAMQQRFPDTQTLVLDANFPFLTGFPLLPHLSHDDGRKVDLAFHYQDATGYLPRTTKSPIGYFAFEDGPSDCPKNTLSLRWNMTWLQSLWPDYHLEPERMATALRLLIADARVSKVFIEPHLKMRLNANASKIRFQGCRAARHDDHIHLQL